MLANFLSGLELPAREVAELGAAETNEMRAWTFLLSRSPNGWRPVFGAQAWANYNRGAPVSSLLCFTFQPAANINHQTWRQEGVQR